jgi:hypothetical protein
MKISLIAGGFAILLSACTPAEDATYKKIEDIVLADLTNGVALDVIEGAIAAYVPQGQDVDVVLNDIITYLHDDGVLPPKVLPVALAMQGKIAAKLQLKAGHSSIIWLNQDVTFAQGVVEAVQK